MNAREQQQAEVAAARRLQDEQERLVEAIGEMLYRRSRRKALGSDRLLELRIEQSDVEDLGAIAGQLATDNEDADRIMAAYRSVARSRYLDIETIADLAGAIAKQMGENRPSEASQ